MRRAHRGRPLSRTARLRPDCHSSTDHRFVARGHTPRSGEHDAARPHGWSRRPTLGFALLKPLLCEGSRTRWQLAVRHNGQEAALVVHGQPGHRCLPSCPWTTRSLVLTLLPGGMGMRSHENCRLPMGVMPQALHREPFAAIRRLERADPSSDDQSIWTTHIALAASNLPSMHGVPVPVPN